MNVIIESLSTLWLEFAEHNNSVAYPIKFIVAVRLGLFLLIFITIEKFNLQGRPDHGSVLHKHVVIDSRGHCNVQCIKHNISQIQSKMYQ